MFLHGTLDLLKTRNGHTRRRGRVVLNERASAATKSFLMISTGGFFVRLNRPIRELTN